MPLCGGGRSRQQQRISCSSTEKDEAEKALEQEQPVVSVSSIDLNKEVSKFAKNTATTFAPRASGKSNPAYKGSTLYSVFEWQAYLSVVVGGLLSFNIIFPSDQPDIARLMGMWSLWMFTVPSLRARECKPREKEALNLLFLLIPVINVLLPFVWKSFPFIYTADVVTLVGMYAWKVGGLPGSEEEA
jgi:hypothetical protein